MDASAAGLAESSRRAAKPVGRGGLENALFVVAAAERVPSEIRYAADELTIAFPWGSLLRGALACDERAARGIASLVRRGGRVVAHVSIAARDRLDLVPPDADVAELARRWRAYGLQLCDVRPASPREVAATGSSWARRLATDPSRPVWRLDLERRPDRTDPEVLDDASSARR